MSPVQRACVLLIVLSSSLYAQSHKTYAYVGRVTTDSFLLAWGTADGDGNTIGRDSVSLGHAVVETDNRQVPAEGKNWVEVKGLAPDKTYAYRILVNGQEVGKGEVRTFPEKTDRLSFFVVGDFGTGKPPQYDVARAMIQAFEAKRASNSPVRFVLTLGDNIYSDHVLGLLPYNTGAKDRDWKKKFFEPYEPLLREIPFYPSLGNHDRRDTEGGPDEEVNTYLDNFFRPSDGPSPYYSFSLGGFADFFALDTTAMWAHEPPQGSLVESGSQFQWLQDALAHSTSAWKFAYFHHPPFNAGPGHEPSMGDLSHIVKLFKDTGVQVVFSGHEHNFQFAERNDTTGKTLYIVSGAGGELRSGNVDSAMDRSHIAGTAPQHHFLLVEIEGETLMITPLSSEPVVVRDKDRRPIPMPILVNR